MTEVAQNLHAVRAELDRLALAWNRGPDEVQLLAVSKTKPVEAIREAMAAGQRCFGENYLQEALAKIQTLAGEDLEWHFIGALQSNKTRPVAEHFAWLHSLDSLKHAERLSAQRPGSQPPLNVCIQVNISREPQKAGLMPEQVPQFAQAVAELPGLRLRGLMALPAPSEDFEQQRQAFRAVREILNGLRHQGLAVDTLSMDMSGDLEAAVAEGATVVRVGTAIFGSR